VSELSSFKKIFKSGHYLRRYCILSGGIFDFELCAIMSVLKNLLYWQAIMLLIRVSVRASVRQPAGSCTKKAYCERKQQPVIILHTKISLLHFKHQMKYDIEKVEPERRGLTNTVGW